MLGTSAVSPGIPADDLCKGEREVMIAAAAVVWCTMSDQDEPVSKEDTDDILQRF